MYWITDLLNIKKYIFEMKQEISKTEQKHSRQDYQT